MGLFRRKPYQPYRKKVTQADGTYFLATGYNDENGTFHMEGPGKKFYQTGELMFDGEYLQGKAVKGCTYHKDGTPQYDGAYRDGKRHGTGKLYWGNGKLKYEGTFKAGQFSGEGKLYYETGVLQYEGEFRDGKPCGRGKLYREDGSLLFEGAFEDGEPVTEKRESHKEYYRDGALKYDGQYLNGKRHGQGKQYRSDGTLEVEGQYRDGLPCGTGRLYYKDGKSLRYEGEYQNGKACGKGTEYYQSGGVKYRGEYRNGWWHGTGRKYREDGTLSYTGAFQNGKWHGQGKWYREKNGALYYEGAFVDGERNGTGKEYREDGTLLYAGGFRKDKWHGAGKEYRPDGSLRSACTYVAGRENGHGREYYPNGAVKYDGEYVNDNWQGEGKLYREDGTLLYEGSFKDSNVHGFGREYWPNGALFYEGGYENGERQGEGRAYDEDGTLKLEGIFLHGKWHEMSPIEYQRRMNATKKPDAPPPRTPARRDGSALEELDALIGLGSVKKAVRELRKKAMFQQMAQERGLDLPDDPPAMHMVFYGNPGTGKTVVARLIGEIYHELGLLPKSQVLEVKRPDLVGEYIGATEKTTMEVIQRAMGGVLFIDEAYTLTPPDGGGKDFGQVAVNTLLTAMEEYRDKLVVIVAGYRREMDRFLASNPGLSSRFTEKIQFDDYSGPELAQIFRGFAKKLAFAPGAKEELLRVCEDIVRHKDENFGNGRDARKLFGFAYSNLKSRVLSGSSEPTDAEMTTLTPEDIRAAAQKFNGQKRL